MNSLAATIISSAFLRIVDSISLGHTYYLFAAFTVIYFLIAKFLLPETKKKTLEEVQTYFENRRVDFDESVPVTD